MSGTESSPESMQSVHDDFEANLPPEVVKMRAETAAFLAELEKMGRMWWPFEWLFQRAKNQDEMFVYHHELVPGSSRRAGLRMLAFLACIGLYFLALAEVLPLWVAIVPGAVLGGMAIQFVSQPLQRARAYRNGYLARGRDDQQVFKGQCGDPVCQEEMQRELFALDLRANTYL